MSIKWAHGIPSYYAFLDDILIVGPQAQWHVLITCQYFRPLLQFGVLLAWDKSKGLAISLMYLGKLLDSKKGMSTLPGGKIENLKGLLCNLLYKKKCTLREVQKVLSDLNFPCKAMYPGRAFCPRLAQSMAEVTAPHHFRRITHGLQSDLEVWLEFLDHFNGE